MNATLSYPTDLNYFQSILIKANLPESFSRLRRHDPIEIINAIAYLVKTGCQWRMLPVEFPPWQTVYHHFRSLSDKGWFESFLMLLIHARYAHLGEQFSVAECIIDSQSVRSALSDSQKGIDGNKRIKGIKRHIAVDSHGYVLGAWVTTANVHDSKGAIPMMANLIASNPDLELIKADLGYRSLVKTFEYIGGVHIDCVQSNFGTSDFIPLEGRWVVERTISWMENYRRLTRNYERLLKTANNMLIVACAFFMLRYFA